MPATHAPSPAPQDYPRHTLAESKQLLRDYVWHLDRMGAFHRQTADEVLLLWLIDHVEQPAPKDHTKWDELRWYPRVKVSGAIRAAAVNEARTITTMRDASYQATRDSLKRLSARGLISYDDGYQNIRIVCRDQDDAAPAGLTRKRTSSGRRTVLRAVDEVEYCEPVLKARPGVA